MESSAAREGGRSAVRYGYGVYGSTEWWLRVWVSKAQIGKLAMLVLMLMFERVKLPSRDLRLAPGLVCSDSRDQKRPPEPDHNCID
jgi:hypothetical protein